MELDSGWELASAGPGSRDGPGSLAGLDWLPATVPGTAAGAVGADGRDFDAEDWWFRCRFSVPEHLLTGPVGIQLEGIATVSEVFLNGELLLESTSMWRSHEVDVTTRLLADSELVICCRALSPLLMRRRRPAARWRTRVVNAGNLRWYRTMVFGRSPGFAAGPAAVGPWRPVRLVDRGCPGVRSLHVRTRVDDRGHGRVAVQVAPHGSWSTPEVTLAGRSAELRSTSDGGLEASLEVEEVKRWWPHTHGEPALHELAVTDGGRPLVTRRLGFRRLDWSADIPEKGLELVVNGVPMFARGAVWTPADLISLAPTDDHLRALLHRVRDAGMNMLRVVGTGAYESRLFHDLCDELGILVWQDLMFANLDYPIQDPDFAGEVERETRQVLGELAWRPSLAVVCGNSEVEQQPAMMGLDPELGRGALWDEVIPQLLEQAQADCAYVRSTPCGGDLPFHPDRGVTHYFGVSGYFRELGDARRAEVRFASECLAFANVPDQVDVPVHHPRWKAGVIRDAGTGWDIGAGWDFDDVRDHYLALLFGVDPVALRRYDHARYLELSRAASGEVMAEVMGEWRRRDSPCRGALVLWLKDMLPGAGFGLLDHLGMPKVAYHHLRRALAPLAVWTTDEGVGGIAVHVANDHGRSTSVRLRVALYRHLETQVAEAEEVLELAAHQTLRRTVEGMLGRFVDPAWAYRFGPPAADAVVVSLETSGDHPHLISQAVRFPAGRPTQREPATCMRVETAPQREVAGQVSLRILASRLVYAVRLDLPGFAPDDDSFSLEPGRARVIRLTPLAEHVEFTGGSLTALNLQDAVRIAAL